jgi:MFS family permease
MKEQIFKNKGFLTLMVAQLISGLGDWLSIVAIMTLVGLKWDSTPLEVSFIILSLAIPMALFGPFAGIIADRFNRKQLLIFSDIVRACLILSLTWANSLSAVYACLFAIGFLSAIFIPAKNGMLKELVKDVQMKSAMSISSMIDSMTKVLGPLVSGILVTVFGTKIIFTIDSASFFVSAILIMFLPKMAKVVVEGQDFHKKSSFKEDFIEGMQRIQGNRLLLVGLSLLGVSLFILQLSDSQIIVLIRELSHASPDLFGLIVTAAGLGTLFAGMILAKKTTYHAFRLILLGVFGIGASFSLMAVLAGLDLPFSTLWGLVLGFSAGLSAGLVFIPFQATVQVDTPVHLTGRVFGVVNSVTTTATIVGPLIGGWLATIYGVIPTFIVTGVLLIVISIIGYVFRNKIERGKRDVTTSEQAAQRTTSS